MTPTLELTKERIGFIGCGSLTKMLVKRLVRSQKCDCEIVVSEKNPAVSNTLMQDYGVSRRSKNQDIIDEADIVVICLPKAVASEEIDKLKFDVSKLVISMVGGLTYSELSELVFPAKCVVAMLPGLPSSLGEGLTIVYPDNDRSNKFLANFGDILLTKDENEYVKASIFGGISGCLFHQAFQIFEVLQEREIGAEDAQQIIANAFYGVGASLKFETEATDFYRIVKSVITPGGITEKGIQKLNCFLMKEAWRVATVNMEIALSGQTEVA